MIGFSRPWSIEAHLHPDSQVISYLHFMVAVRRAPLGAPVSILPGRLTCVQLPPLV
ncbi:conserved hypothetical protein [Pseudomonas jessenii]